MIGNVVTDVVGMSVSVSTLSLVSTTIVLLLYSLEFIGLQLCYANIIGVSGVGIESP